MNIARKKRMKNKILPFILFLIVGRQFFSSKLFPSTTFVKLKLVLVKVWSKLLKDITEKCLRSVLYIVRSDNEPSYSYLWHTSHYVDDQSKRPKFFIEWIIYSNKINQKLKTQWHKVFWAWKISCSKRNIIRIIQKLFPKL